MFETATPTCRPPFSWREVLGGSAFPPLQPVLVQQARDRRGVMALKKGRYALFRHVPGILPVLGFHVKIRTGIHQQPEAKGHGTRKVAGSGP